MRQIVACLLWYVLGSLVTWYAVQTKPVDMTSECREVLVVAAHRLAEADRALGPSWRTAAWYQQAYLQAKK
jgi:hypothetical protein